MARERLYAHIGRERAIAVNQYVDRTSLLADLRRIGIRPGDDLIVHASYKSIGNVAGGPNAVASALVDAVGTTGHLMMPTFTYSAPIFNEEPFDCKSTPSRTGVISEMLRRRSEARRSFHPTHSFVVIGKHAEELTNRHLDYAPLGVGSPLARMADRNAKILLVGTGQTSNSSVHYGESYANAPYLHVPYSNHGQATESAWFADERGETAVIELKEMPGCSSGFSDLDAKLLHGGVASLAYLGNATCQLMYSQQLREFIRVELTERMDSLLCSREECRICSKRRSYLLKASPVIVMKPLTACRPS